MSLYSDPVFWLCVLNILLIMVCSALVRRQARRGEQQAKDEVQTQCHWCSKRFDPENSEAPAHYKFYFCGLTCYQQARACGKA